MRYSPKPTQLGVFKLVKVVPSKQVIVSLPLSRNSSSHDTVSSVPAFTGNVVSVLRLFQAGSRSVHCATSKVCSYRDVEISMVIARSTCRGPLARDALTGQ